MARRRFVFVTVVGGSKWECRGGLGSGVGIIPGTDPTTGRLTGRNIRHAL